jgi:hypothetical protein
MSTERILAVLYHRKGLETQNALTLATERL